MDSLFSVLWRCLFNREEQGDGCSSDTSRRHVEYVFQFCQLISGRSLDIDPALRSPLNEHSHQILHIAQYPPKSNLYITSINW